MDWFTSDTHLGHWNINKHCNRGFASLEEMDKTLLGNINKLVQPNDRLAIVGDFAWWRCSPKQLEDYRAAINCRNVYLIIGNHDEPVLDDLRPLFVRTEHLLEIKVQTPENSKQRIIMSHYAMRVWNQSHRRSFHLAGHSHGKLKEILPNEHIGGLALDVGVDVHNYQPISLEDVNRIMKYKLSHWTDPFDQWEKEGTLYRVDSRTTPEHE